MWSFEVLHRGIFPSDLANREERVSEVMTVLEGKLNSRKREWVERKLERLEETPLEQRIYALLKELPVPASSESIRGFAQRCAEYRNELSHFGGPRIQPAAEDYYQKLSETAEAAQILFGLILLQQCGMNVELISKAIRESTHAKFRLLPKLRKVGLDEA
jgi:hypothetical protein